MDDRLVETLILVAGLLLAVRAGEWMARRGAKDERKRYTIRKVIRHTALSVFLVAALGIWAQRLQGLLDRRHRQCVGAGWSNIACQHRS